MNLPLLLSFSTTKYVRIKSSIVLHHQLVLLILLFFPSDTNLEFSPPEKANRMELLSSFLAEPLTSDAVPNCDRFLAGAIPDLNLVVKTVSKQSLSSYISSRRVETKSDQSKACTHAQYPVFLKIIVGERILHRAQRVGVAET